MKKLSLVIMTMGIMWDTPSYAFYCTEPSYKPPYCTDQMIGETFESESDFDSCKYEMKKYIRELGEWVACIQKEANERSEKAVKKFNCKAEGQSFC